MVFPPKMMQGKGPNKARFVENSCTNLRSQFGDGLSVKIDQFAHCGGEPFQSGRIEWVALEALLQSDNEHREIHRIQRQAPLAHRSRSADYWHGRLSLLHHNS